jgi:DNA-directed RNA polymerase alpha subunit
MLSENHIQALTILISGYAEKEKIVPKGQQLHVSFDLKPVPEVPIVVISGTTLATASVSLNSIGLKARTFSALNEANMKTVSDILQFVSKTGSTTALLRYRNFGTKALMDLIECLKRNRFPLGQEWDKR